MTRPLRMLAWTCTGLVLVAGAAAQDSPVAGSHPDPPSPPPFPAEKFPALLADPFHKLDELVNMLPKVEPRRGDDAIRTLKLERYATAVERLLAMVAFYEGGSITIDQLYASLFETSGYLAEATPDPILILRARVWACEIAYALEARERANLDLGHGSIPNSTEAEIGRINARIAVLEAWRAVGNRPIPADIAGRLTPPDERLPVFLRGKPLPKPLSDPKRRATLLRSYWSATFTAHRAMETTYGLSFTLNYDTGMEINKRYIEENVVDLSERLTVARAALDAACALSDRPADHEALRAEFAALQKLLTEAPVREETPPEHPTRDGVPLAPTFGAGHPPMVYPARTYGPPILPQRRSR